MTIAILFSILKILRIVAIVVIVVVVLLMFVPIIYKIDVDSTAKDAYVKAKWLGGVLGFFASFENGKLTAFLRVAVYKKYFFTNKKKNVKIAVETPTEHKEEETESKTTADHVSMEQNPTDTDESGFDWDPDEYDDPDEEKSGVFASIKSFLHTLKMVQETSIISYTYPKVSKLLYRIRPRSITGDVMFGFADPSTTGMVTGAIAMLPFLYGTDLDITPDFEADENFFTGNVHAQGRIFIILVTIVALRLLFDKNFRRKLKKVRGKA